MLWPSILPLNSLIETLHRDKDEMRQKFNMFWIVFGVVAAWELFPQYIMPVLTGVSVFCEWHHPQAYPCSSIRTLEVQLRCLSQVRLQAL